MGQTKNLIPAVVLLTISLLSFVWDPFRDTSTLSKTQSVRRTGNNVLTSRGKPLPIGEYPYIVQHENLRIVVQNEKQNRVPRADGDEAMQHILNVLDIGRSCKADPSLWVVDVGGLYGDFGLLAGARGCHTVIYEPQKDYAERIARSVLLNGLESLVEVHYAAVSPKRDVSFDTGKGSHGQATLVEASGVDAHNRIPTEKIDDRFLPSNDKILFLKVDVEGNEDEVWNTAKKLFQLGRILNAIFEYTPYQFKDRGTDYESFLPRLFSEAKANVCYALHRTREKVFRIPKDQIQQFYERMLMIRMQTDVYCTFGDQKDMFQDAPDWTTGTSFVGG